MKLLVLLFAVGFAAGGHVGTVTSQFHAQDELGQYSYGYSGGPSAKHETRTADGLTQGGYSYIDGHGLVQSAAYVSDAHNGFRVAATNLPVGPAVPAGPAVVAAAAPVVAAPAIASVVAAPAIAPVVAAPAIAAAPLIAGHGLLAAPAVSTISVHGGLLGGLGGLGGLAGLGGLGGYGGLLRHRRSVVVPYAHQLAPVWHGIASNNLAETLAPTGHETIAVAHARNAHAVTHAATTARDIANHGVWGVAAAPVVAGHGLLAAPAVSALSLHGGLLGGLGGLGGYGGLLRHRRSVVVPYAHLAPVWHGIASNHLAETLAPTGHETFAVAAARNAHAVTHSATTARDIANHGAWSVLAAPAIVGHAGILHGGLLRHKRGLALAAHGLPLAHALPIAHAVNVWHGPASNSLGETLAPTGHETIAVATARNAHAAVHAATTHRDIVNNGAVLAAAAPVIAAPAIAAAPLVGHGLLAGNGLIAGNGLLAGNGLIAGHGLLPAVASTRVITPHSDVITVSNHGLLGGHLRKRRNIHGLPLLAAPIAPLAHVWAGPASNNLAETLAPTGHETLAVAAARNAHAVTHAATSARDIANHGVWGVAAAPGVSAIGHGAVLAAPAVALHSNNILETLAPTGHDTIAVANARAAHLATKAHIAHSHWG